MPRSRRAKDILQAFLEYLLWRLPKIYAASNVRRGRITQPRLRTVRRTARLLERLPPSYHISAALRHLRAEEKLLQGQAQYRTYRAPFTSRKSPKAEGNIEETECLFIAQLLVRRLYPGEGPYDVLSSRLPSTRQPVAIKRRVERLESRRAADPGWRERLLDAHYASFKRHWVHAKHRELWAGTCRKCKGKRIVFNARTGAPLKCRVCKGTGTQPVRVKKLTRLMRFTSREQAMLRHLCS